MKTETSRIAGQYAEATLELACAQKVEEQILTDLSAVNKAINAEADMSTILRHPSVPAADKKQLLVQMFQRNVNDLTMRLLQLLADKRRLQLLPALESEYRASLRKRKNVVKASLVSAEPLRDATVQNIVNKLAAKLGKRVELDAAIDRSLIAGAILRVGDEVIDGSLRGRLQTLEKELLSV